VAKTQTPWGPAEVVERVAVRQQTKEKQFASVVELLETVKGDQLVRIAYSTDGANRRGPVTLRVRDLEKLREAVAAKPELQEALGWTSS